MDRPSRLLTVAAFTLLALAAPVSAQSDASEAVARLSVGQTVRVQAPGMSVESGEVSEMDPQTLYVLEEGQEWMIDIPSIERLEVRHRSVLKSTVIWGLVGLTAGAAASNFREGDVSKTPFILGGLAFGAGYGLLNWKWSVIYPG